MFREISFLANQDRTGLDLPDLFDLVLDRSF
jgi:hypothetical protein